jgi:hypothetical protein
MVHPPFVLKVQINITSTRQRNPPVLSALFPEMESVPEKRFSGQNLFGCFWVVVEDWPNILFRQRSVNSEHCRKETALGSGSQNRRCKQAGKMIKVMRR